MEEASARREAERGTFDPTYLVYTVGKLMLLKLRQDYKAAAGQGVLAAHVPRHAARQRHRAVLAAPQLMLGDEGDCWSEPRSLRSLSDEPSCPCTNISATRAGTGSR